MRRSSSSVGAEVVAIDVGDPERPADRLLGPVERRARVERVEAHLAVLVEVVDAEVRDDDRRAAPEPALLAPDPLALLGAAEVARARPEVDLLDEAPGRLAHDHEHLAGVDRDLAGTAAPRETRLRGVVVADHGRVDVAEAVDLRRAEEPDVDEAALEVEREELEHARHRGRAGHDRRVADAQAGGGPAALRRPRPRRRARGPVPRSAWRG